MTETTTTGGFGPFGEVLAELMRTRGLVPDEETITALALDAYMDPHDLDHEMRAPRRGSNRVNPITGDTHALAWVLSLTEPEKCVFGEAFSWREGDAESVREIRKTPQHGEASEARRPDYPGALPRPLVRYLDAELAEAMPCWAGHGGDDCPRPATMCVYDFYFCAVHGAEAASGAREELYEDACERLASAAKAPGANPAAVAVLKREAMRASVAGSDEMGNGEALLMAAFPDPPERPDTEVSRYYAGAHHPDDEDPADWYMERRRNLHGLMRTAYHRGEDTVLETLEDERQELAPHAAYAVAVRDGLYPERVEEARLRAVECGGPPA
jgi:hypothetical protein